MQISFVGFQPVQSSEHMAVSSVVVLLTCYYVVTITQLLIWQIYILRCRHLVCSVCARSMPLWTTCEHACPKITSSCCSRVLCWLQQLASQLLVVYSPSLAKSLPGPAASTLCWTRRMPKTTFPLLHQFLNINRQHGRHSTLTCSCWCSCSLLACITAFLSSQMQTSSSSCMVSQASILL